MTKIAIAILIGFVSFLSLAQAENVKTKAVFHITRGDQNGSDMTSLLLKNGAFTAFYKKLGNRRLHMANVWPNAGSQSYGPLYPIKSAKSQQTYDSYEADFYNFSWNYANTYNSKTGVALVQIIRVYKPEGVAFIIKIIPENKDVLTYQGIMEGSIDFLKK